MLALLLCAGRAHAKERWTTRSSYLILSTNRTVLVAARSLPGKYDRLVHAAHACPTWMCRVNRKGAARMSDPRIARDCEAAMAARLDSVKANRLDGIGGRIGRTVRRRGQANGHVPNSLRASRARLTLPVVPHLIRFRPARFGLLAIARTSSVAKLCTGCQVRADEMTNRRPKARSENGVAAFGLRTGVWLAGAQTQTQTSSRDAPARTQNLDVRLPPERARHRLRHPT